MLTADSSRGVNYGYYGVETGNAVGVAQRQGSCSQAILRYSEAKDCSLYAQHDHATSDEPRWERELSTLAEILKVTNCPEKGLSEGGGKLTDRLQPRRGSRSNVSTIRIRPVLQAGHGIVLSISQSCSQGWPSVCLTSPAGIARRGGAQQAAAGCQFLLPVTIGQIPVVADPHEAVG